MENLIFSATRQNRFQIHILLNKKMKSEQSSVITGKVVYDLPFCVTVCGVLVPSAGLVPHVLRAPSAITSVFFH